VNVTAGVVHHSLYVVAGLADDVRVLRVRDLHLQRHTRRRLTTHTSAQLLLTASCFTFLNLLPACVTFSQIQEIARSFLGSGLTRNILECSLALNVTAPLYSMR